MPSGVLFEHWKCKWWLHSVCRRGVKSSAESLWWRNAPGAQSAILTPRDDTTRSANRKFVLWNERGIQFPPVYFSFEYKSKAALLYFFSSLPVSTPPPPWNIINNLLGKTPTCSVYKSHIYLFMFCVSRQHFAEMSRTVDVFPFQALGSRF